MLPVWQFCMQNGPPPRGPPRTLSWTKACTGFTLLQNFKLLPEWHVIDNLTPGTLQRVVCGFQTVDTGLCAAPSPGQVASGAKDAANKVADAAPSKDNFLGGILKNAPDSGDVKGAFSDASSAAKEALPNSGASKQPGHLSPGLFWGARRCVRGGCLVPVTALMPTHKYGSYWFMRTAYGGSGARASSNAQFGVCISRSWGEEGRGEVRGPRWIFGLE